MLYFANDVEAVGPIHPGEKVISVLCLICLDYCTGLNLFQYIGVRYILR